MSMLDCSCGFGARWELEPFSAEWHRQHRTRHLAVYPNVDQSSRDNLAMFVDRAAARESARPGC